MKNDVKIEALTKKLEKHIEVRKRIEEEINSKNQVLSDTVKTIENIEMNIKALKLENLESAVSDKYGMDLEKFYNALANNEIHIGTVEEKQMNNSADTVKENTVNAVSSGFIGSFRR